MFPIQLPLPFVEDHDDTRSEVLLSSRLLLHQFPLLFVLVQYSIHPKNGRESSHGIHADNITFLEGESSPRDGVRAWIKTDNHTVFVNVRKVMTDVHANDSRAEQRTFEAGGPVTKMTPQRGFCCVVIFQ